MVVCHLKELAEVVREQRARRMCVIEEWCRMRVVCVWYLGVASVVLWCVKSDVNIPR